MKTFKELRIELEEFISDEYFVEDLDSDDLYSVLVNEDIDDYTRCIVALELFERREIELSEDEYNDLLEVAADKPRYRVPAEVRDVKPDPRTYSAVQDVKKASDNKDLGMKGRVSKGSVPKTSSMADRISAKDRVPAKSSNISKTLGPLAAAGGGYVAGKNGGKGGFSGSVAGGAAAGGIPGAVAGGVGYLAGRAKSKEGGTSGIKRWDGTVQGSKKSSVSKPSVSDNTSGMKLTGKAVDPVSTALRGAEPEPQVNQRLIGPMGGAKADTSSGNAARTASQKSPSSGIKRLSTATGKPSKNIPVVDTAVKPISKGSKSSAPVPVIKKVSPQELTKPKIAAKVNKAGRATPDVAQQTGVTARMGQSGRTQTFSNIARGASSDKSSSGMFQKAGTEYTTQKNLPPQGSAARDVELAKRGYKKF